MNNGIPTGIRKIKKILTSDLFLTHYNLDLEIIVASDTSSYGIGVCILHKMNDGTTKPIAHVSRALLLAEKNYSQIEKEALAIIFVISKFHCFIHGWYFILQTDHKPLLTIFGLKKKVCLWILPTDCRDGVPSYSIIILKWSTYHQINLDMWIDFQISRTIGRHSNCLSPIRRRIKNLFAIQ